MLRQPEAPCPSPRLNDLRRPEIARDGALDSAVALPRRSETKQALRGISTDDWEEGVDFAEATWRHINGFVRQRRSADKLNHFHRWAYERTSQLPTQERVDAIRSVLPAGLIGDHALAHLERDTRLTVDLTRKRWVTRSRLLDRGELAQLFRQLISIPDAVRSLHRCIKTATLRLHGAHDVLRFLHDVEKHRATRFVVDDFARVFKTTNDAQRACLAASVCVELPRFDWVGRHE